ncbi:adenylyl-sulfate kinase [Candidatus Woesearchaeota archaeon]|jgi:adenylylsulfate kinase|nr:adenylyl-sulfate kinase [Candidatus Woesearchaeota archaeon]MBT4322103.1 adenylyl-sulfate kinase [Candidatus Woesearchaeota archaeon]MBT4630680.1 adenylyl-sulfate kinase [Candidatus Woesearchaeota archaeon]
MPSPNIIWHSRKISRENRLELTKTKNKVIWFTGLSGSGKSTIAIELEKKLHEKGILSYVLDGDNVRHGLNKDLGFSTKDREENIRRLAELTKLFYDAGIFTIASFISPLKKERDLARSYAGEDFIEVYVDCPLEECEKRDTKGLYKKARSGELKEFTGISHSYEVPENPEITINTKDKNVEGCVEEIMKYLKL